MRGFGNLKNIEEMKACFESVDDGMVDDVPMDTDNVPTDTEDENALENVVVPTLKTDEYKKEKKVASEIVPDDGKKIGAAGTAEIKEEKPIMGGMGSLGLGGGIDKEMSKMEGFTPDQVVDDESMKNAKDVLNSNVIDRVKNVFTMMYDNSYRKAKDKKYDLDSTYQKAVVSTEPIKRIPKGW